MAAGAELNHWCFCQLMQIQCVGSAWVLASSPPTAECVFLSLSDSFFFLFLMFLFFRMCMPENGKGPRLFLFNTVTNPVFASVCVCHTAFWMFKPSRSGTQARLTLWPTRGLKRRSFSLLSVYQHNAAHGDKWRQLLWYRMGSSGAWIINIFYEVFSFPLWCIVLLWPLAPSSSSHRTRLRIGDCIMSVALVRTQAIMYYSCGTIKI